MDMKNRNMNLLHTKRHPNKRCRCRTATSNGKFIENTMNILYDAVMDELNHLLQISEGVRYCIHRENNSRIV